MKKDTKYQQIWKIVKQVPVGKVASYGQIARVAGIPGHARFVGYALHNLPQNSDVPWHRVINSQGRISLPQVDGSYELQKTLLEQEGVVFYKERVDLVKFGWEPELEAMFDQFKYIKIE
jgi:methylated-DNA-protein-cysteine methyltransferase-like protein